MKKSIKKDTNVFNFKVIKTYKRARVCNLILPHGKVNLPIYMPVGTKGSIKGLTSQDIENTNCWLMLGNTYHLNNKPGSEFLLNHNGLHNFMNWKRNLLTDSGGFQMVSLSKFCNITEEGVEFEHPTEKTKMFLRPEDSIKAQIGIGADIMMALDDVVKTTTIGNRVEEACDRTIRWIDRNLSANTNKNKQTIFPIIQGSLDLKLRKHCIEKLVEKNTFGIAIGGLSGGEKKEDFIKIVSYCTENISHDKPKYLMGVGYPIDLIICICLGVDMFDCVFPTRTARFGNAFTDSGIIKLKNENYYKDFTPIDENCDCDTCKNYTKAYINKLIKKNSMTCTLISIHNIRYLLRLMDRLRKNIINETLEEFVIDYLNKNFENIEKYPEWVKIGLKLANFDKFN